MLSKQVGDAMRAGETAKAEALREESRPLGNELATVEREGSKRERQLRDAMLRLPNLPAPEAPDGASEADNVVVRTVGYDPSRYGPHQRVPTGTSAPNCRSSTWNEGPRSRGSMFPLFTGQGATLVRALCQLALDRNSDAFTEVRPPTLVRTPAMEAVGQLPKFADDAYHLERDDLWAVPTAEVPLTSMRANEILAEEELPVRAHGVYALLPAGGGSGWPGHAGLAHGCTSSTRSRSWPFATRADAAALHQELLERAIGSIAALGPALPGSRHLHGRPRAVARPSVRHRGVRAGLRHVARGLVGLVVQRLPGPAGLHPLPANGGRPNADLRHAERVRSGRTQGVGGAGGDVPPA